MTPARPVLERARLRRALAGPWRLATAYAPAGWGKTTLLAHRCPPRSTLWVTASAAERDPAQLLGALLASGARLSPPFGTATIARFTARRDFERDGGLLTAALLHELASDRRRLVIAIDDAHHLSGARAALHWLAGLIERSPASVRFMLAGRGEPLWPVGRFAAAGERHLSREQLAFDRAEAARLLARDRVPAGERRAIIERQGGWVAGLAAAGRAVRAGRSGEAAWATMTEDELAALSGPERRTVLLASTLEDLDVRPLVVLLGAARARALLRLIRQRGLPVDDSGGRARFHPLFLDVLRELAARELPAAVRARACRSAARAYARQGEPARAIAAVLASGAETEAVRAFERASRDSEHDGALAALACAWLAAGRPAAALASPAVHLLAARAHADNGELRASFERAVHAAEGWLARGRTLESARAFALIMTLALQTGQHREAIETGARLYARLVRRDRAAAAIVRARLGALRLYAGDPESARRDLDAALRSLPPRLAIERAEAEVHRATVEFTAGRWTLYLTRTRRALESYRRAGYWARAYALLVNMAEAYIYLGEEAVARRHLDEAAELAPRSGLHARAMLLELSRARAYSEEGRLADAGRAFASARRESARASTPLFEGMLDLWEGVWRRRRGMLAAAVRALGRAARGFERLESPAWLNVARLELALARGLSGDATAALRQLAACARSSRKFGDRKEEARSVLFGARLLQHAGRPHRAAFARALRLLDAENYRVLLRKERDVAAPLLAEAERPRAARSASGPPAGVARAATAPPRAPHVRVRLLGGFALEYAGRAALPSRTAARMIVAVLALHAGRPQRREALIELLWPGSPPEAGRNRLDVALHDARRTLDPSAGPRGPFTVLRSERGLVWLDDLVERDVAVFETLAEQAAREGTDAAAERALAAYPGPCLPEWPDADWAEDTRSRLGSLAQRLWLARAHAAFTHQRPADTLAHAARVLEHDALHEDAIVWKLRALVRLGRSAEARKVFAAHDERCRRELDAPPGPELVALARELGVTADGGGRAAKVDVARDSP